MIRKLSWLVLAFTLSMGTAYSQIPPTLPTEQFGAYLDSLPSASSVATSDQLYLRQGGVSRRASAALVPLAPGVTPCLGCTAGNLFTSTGSPPILSDSGIPASLLLAVPPGNTICNSSGVTGPAGFCSPFTAVPPLGISGTALNTNTASPNGLFIGGAGPAGTVTTTSVGIGLFSLLSLTTGQGNFGLGNGSLVNITTGSNNVGVGVNAGAGLTGAATSNVAVGPATLGISSSGIQNTAIGADALNKSTGNNSTGIGELALFDATSGSNNTGVGPSSGRGITTGSNNSIFGGCTGLAAALANAIGLCDGAGNMRVDWAITAAATLTLNGPVVSTTTVQTKFIYSAAGTPLPTCNSGLEGARASVSDATSPTFLGTYTSGGAVHAPVYCNGTNWVTN